MKLTLKPYSDEIKLSATFSINQGETGLECTWEITGDTSTLSLPVYDSKGRRLYLWLDTCFEFFLKFEGNPDYYEFNFAPDSCFNIFHLDSYRAPIIETTDFTVSGLSMDLSDDQLQFHARITPAIKLPAMRANFLPSMVVKKKNGEISFWASDHSENKPDFHDAVTFKNELIF